MSRKADPLPARTRQLLFNALIELIPKKRWEQIRVQDILDATGVGRSTFYAHYDNKFDLLTAEIPELTVPISSSDGEPDLLPLFQHVQEMQPVMKPIMSQPVLGEITDVFQQRLATAWTSYLTNLGVEGLRLTVAAEALAGAFMAVNRRWLKDGCATSPEEMSELFSKHVTAIVTTASR